MKEIRSKMSQSSTGAELGKVSLGRVSLQVLSEEMTFKLNDEQVQEKRSRHRKPTEFTSRYTSPKKQHKYSFFSPNIC